MKQNLGIDRFKESKEMLNITQRQLLVAIKDFLLKATLSQVSIIKKHLYQFLESVATYQQLF